MSTVDLLRLAAQPVRPFESVPVIDISGLSGDADSKALVASEIRDACIHVGFFYVKNHGIDEALITSALDAVHRFYDIPMEEKLKLDFNNSPNFNGYYPITKKKYINECYVIGPETNASSDNAMRGSNVWPPEDVVPAFKEAMLKYYQEVAGLGLKLLSAFALALNLPEDYFADKVRKAGSRMRLLHYPLQTEIIDGADPGIGSHTDFECFTILLQDEVPALQVLNSSGQWIDARPIPGTFVINIGDQLSRWTNDIFKSTIHRAISKSGARRYSIPLFFGSDYNVMLEVLPSCVSANRPARYEPMPVGDFVRSRLQHYYPDKK